MTASYTARFTRIPSGYMGQIVEWPEVVTEGADLEDCRESLKDALDQMVIAYRNSGWEIPLGTDLLSAMTTEV
jgi:predicted RNase H-like HicB family nuclease